MSNEGRRTPTQHGTKKITFNIHGISLIAVLRRLFSSKVIGLQSNVFLGAAANDDAAGDTPRTAGIDGVRLRDDDGFGAADFFFVAVPEPTEAVDERRATFFFSLGLRKSTSVSKRLEQRCSAAMPPPPRKNKISPVSTRC